MPLVALCLLALVLSPNAFAQEADLTLDFTGSRSGDACAPVFPCDPQMFPIPLGYDVDYAAIVQNLGPSRATDVTVTFALPQRITIQHTTIATPGSCITSSALAQVLVTCTLRDLAPYETDSAYFRLKLNPDYMSSRLVTSATVRSSTQDPIAANNSGVVNLPVILPLPTFETSTLFFLAAALAAIGIVAVRR